ncbi:MAG: hypothetical protein WCC92_04960 [Candidatus Korobacteraceae bacterium]
MKAVADNDILLKGACYGLLPEFVGAVPGTGHIGILGASIFVVPSKIKKQSLRGDPAVVQTRFAAFVADNELLEPSCDEQSMAALFEATAQKLALNLDTGESQLVAMLVSRSLPWLLTGDKRAIAAIENLFDADTRLAVVAGKIRSLEHLIRDVLASGIVDQVRGAICAEPAVDKALSICFSCSGSHASSATVSEGLSSYIADLRSRAARVLAT